MAKAVIRNAGVKKALALEVAARQTVGLKSALEFARMEIDYLLVQYELLNVQLTTLMTKIEAVLARLPEAKAARYSWCWSDYCCWLSRRNR